MKAFHVKNEQNIALTPDQKKQLPHFPQISDKIPPKYAYNGQDSNKTSKIVFDLGQKSDSAQRKEIWRKFKQGVMAYIWIFCSF